MDCSKNEEDYGHIFVAKKSCNSYKTAESTSCKCYVVKPIHQIELWKVPEEVSFCGLKNLNMTFMNLYKNVGINGKCKKGFKRCESSFGVKQEVCVKKDQLCPITDIQFKVVNPDKEKYEGIEARYFNLFYSRKATNNPIVDLILTENGMCLSNLLYSSSHGRKKYPLMNFNGDGDCVKDQRYKNMGVFYGEKDLLEINDVGIGSLPGFETSNNYKWSYYSREMIQWNPSCEWAISVINKAESSFSQLKMKFTFDLV